SHECPPYGASEQARVSAGTSPEGRDSTAQANGHWCRKFRLSAPEGRRSIARGENPWSVAYPFAEPWKGDGSRRTAGTGRLKSSTPFQGSRNCCSSDQGFAPLAIDRRPS